MKIGFDISQTGSNKAGCGYFASNLIQALADVDKKNKYVLYPSFGDHFWGDKNTVVSIKQENFQYGLKHSSLTAAQHFWDTFSTEQEKQLGEIDILHCNNYFCPPKLKNSKIIYTLYDLSFLSYPEYTTEANRLSCFYGVFNASNNADYIVAISEYSRKNFLDYFPHFPQGKISVIYPASRFTESVSIANSKFSNLSELLPGQFWLNVGTIEPRKNYKNLLLAYAKFKKINKINYPLVLAGSRGWMSDDFEEMLDDLNLRNDVFILGYVNDFELKWLYKNCFCLIYPSYFEGFGLPVLEAMSLGALVITSNVSSIPEIVADAGLLIDPHQVDEIVSAMTRITQRPIYCEVLRRKAENQASKFSWQSSAAALLELYKKVSSVT